jgi:hypothetical protein
MMRVLLNCATASKGNISYKSKAIPKASNSGKQPAMHGDRFTICIKINLLNETPLSPETRKKQTQASLVNHEADI